MLILYNIINGKKATLKANKIALILQSKFSNIEVLALQEPGDKLIKAIDLHHEVIIAGGDGTFHQCINLFNFNGKKIGFISTGSGNDFSRQLYGFTKWENQLKILLLNNTKKIDLLLVNDKKCLNNLGIGFDGVAAYTANKIKYWVPGFLKYNLSVLYHLLLYKEKQFIIKSEQIDIDRKLLLASIANGAFAGGGYKLFPKANIFDNLLDVCLIQKVGILERISYFLKVAKGNHTSLKIVQYFQTKECFIKSYEKIPYHMDGEVYFSNEWIVKSITSNFEVFVPAD